MSEVNTVKLMEKAAKARIRYERSLTNGSHPNTVARLRKEANELQERVDQLTK